MSDQRAVQIEDNSAGKGHRELAIRRRAIMQVGMLKSREKRSCEISPARQPSSTGGAGGIRFALARAFAQAGMKVMLADIESDALQAAVESLRQISPDIRGTICDVTDAASVERAAQATFDAFGRVHVVCNNAGVAAGGGIDQISLDNWRWVIDVNLMGVLHGIRSFLPHIRAHGEGGHIVNTASMAGMANGLGFSPYGASKFAVVSMSGGPCRAARAARHRGERVVSAATCAPASARAGAIRPDATASRSRSTRQARRRRWWPRSRGRSQAGLDPAAVAARVLNAIREDELYIFTHPGMRAERWRRDSPPFWPRWTG